MNLNLPLRRAAAAALLVATVVAGGCWGQTSGHTRGPVSYYGDPSAPDMSGPWILTQNEPGKSSSGSGSKEGWRSWPPPLKAPFAATWKQRVADAAAGKSSDPVIGCMPGGMPRFVTADTTPLLIVQTKGRILFYRDGEGPRRVWLDGRAFPAPADLEVFLKGTGIGRYEGSDLMIETRGIRDQPIDSTGVPHSDQLVIKERYHKLDDQTLKVDLTMVDPVAYTRPMTATAIYKRITDPNWAPVEFICRPKTDYHPDKYIH